MISFLPKCNYKIMHNDTIKSNRIKNKNQKIKNDQILPKNNKKTVKTQEKQMQESKNDLLNIPNFINDENIIDTFFNETRDICNNAVYNNLYE